MSLSVQQESALNAALVELRANYAAARIAAGGAFFIDSGAGGSAQGALNTAKNAIALLEGDLLEAARGNHVWPLDDGDSVNSQAALSAWTSLADSVRTSLETVKGYVGKWSALAFLKQVAPDIAANIGIALVVALVIAVLVFKVVK